eukprot:scaffold3103_cov136-Cylindrotheca_fusiformis.AAC.26
MPVLPSPSPFYENEKAGGTFENAAEEILNGLFCHYEPPTSTKAQKNAADKVRKDPVKFLYDEQPRRPILRHKRRSSMGSQSTASSYYVNKNNDNEAVSEADESEYYETEDEEELDMAAEDEDEEEEEESIRKVGKGVKWRDEESKKLEEETKQKGKKSSFCISIPFLGIGTSQDAPKGLTDNYDENSVVRNPDTPGATPTKSALKKSNDMKVLYDDEGNPTSTPRSPGSINSHPFFRNVTNSPRVGMYEPKDYSRPLTPTSYARKMPTHSTPRAPELEKIEQLAKLGRPRQPTPASPSAGAWAPMSPMGVPVSPMRAPMSPMRPDAKAKSYVPKSPRSYMMPMSKYVSPKSKQQPQTTDWEGLVETNVPQLAVRDIVQQLNKSGFIPGRRFRKGFMPNKSSGTRSEYSDITMTPAYRRGDDNRESSTAFVGTRRMVTAPAPLDLSNQYQDSGAAAPGPDAHYDWDAHFDAADFMEVARDPTPRNNAAPSGGSGGYYRKTERILPPTPRVREVPAPTNTTRAPPPSAAPHAQESEENPLIDTKTFTVKEQVTAAERLIRENQKLAGVEKQPVAKTTTQEQEKKKKQQHQQRKKKSEAPQQRKGTSRHPQREPVGDRPNEKKGFMKGIKSSFGKLKSVVNDIDEQRLGDANHHSSSKSNKKKMARKDGAVVRYA